MKRAFTLCYLGLAFGLVSGCGTPRAQEVDTAGPSFATIGHYPFRMGPFTVIVRTNNQYSIDGKLMSWAETRSAMGDCVRYMGPADLAPYPVTESLKGTVFSNAWPVIDRGARCGVHRQGLVTHGHTNMFFVPSREGRNTSPMVLKGFKRNTVPREVDLVGVYADKIVLNGKVKPLSDLQDYLTARPDKTRTVLVMPTDDAPMDQVGTILKTILDTGNQNLCLAAEEKIAQQ